MTDDTQPDSASTTGSTHIIRYALELGLLWIDGDGRDKVREALDALDALEASPTPPVVRQAPKETLGGVNGWRDISTAPKDGSHFVATGYNYGLYSEGRHICVAQWFRGCWMETSDWNEASELQHLTHWLPLPSPPDDVAAPAEQQAAPKAAPGESDPADIIAGALQISRGHAIEMMREACFGAAPQQEAQEPVAWQGVHDRTDLYYTKPLQADVRPLYAAPQPALAPLSDDAKDAARYRWLRATTNYVTSNGERIDVRNMPEKWDAAIDAALARWGTPQPVVREPLTSEQISAMSRKQDEALIRQMHDALCECAEDSQEQLDRMEAAKLRQYKPQAVACQEATIDAAKRAITAARARLSERRNAS